MDDRRDVPRIVHDHPRTVLVLRWTGSIQERTVGSHAMLHHHRARVSALDGGWLQICS